MPKVEIRNEGEDTHYWLKGRELRNGDEIMLRLRGNIGWERVAVDGLPAVLRVRTVANDGHPLVTSLPLESDLRWPTRTDA